MRTERDIATQLQYYRERLAATNQKLQEAILQEDLKAIEIFTSNQVMFAERIMTLEWVLETVDRDGTAYPYTDDVSTSCLEACLIFSL